VSTADCPRARTPMTPCLVRHGPDALDNTGECVGCGWHRRTIEAGQAGDEPRPPRPNPTLAELGKAWDAMTRRR
jgi:hypothetical protein